MLFPIISDTQDYSFLFKDSSIWEKIILYISQKHGLKGKLERATSGSHIVYRVGDHWIKLMAPLYSNDMQFEIEGLKSIEDRLSVQSPKILLTGEIESWKYLVMSHVDGQPIRHLWMNLKQDEKLIICDQIGKILGELKNCRPSKVISHRFIWNSFIQNQYNNVRNLQQQKGLPEPWLNTAEDFLKQSAIDDFLIDQPVLLHADLTFDHLLMKIDPIPRITGIIDMADCQVGHPEYELLVPCCFIFKGESNLLRRFLFSCAYRDSQINQNLSFKLMRWLLLHRYGVIQKIFRRELESCPPGDFKALAQILFPL